jgi:hypothetical protein
MIVLRCFAGHHLQATKILLFIGSRQALASKHFMNNDLAV